MNISPGLFVLLISFMFFPIIFSNKAKEKSAQIVASLIGTTLLSLPIIVTSILILFFIIQAVKIVKMVNFVF
jgi:hypothetical protein